MGWLWTRSTDLHAAEPQLAGKKKNDAEREEPSGEMKGFCFFI